MSVRHASCACGQLKLACEGEPVRISMCHCLSCQKRTGSAFGIQARFPQDKVTIDGRSNLYERIGDSGGRAMFRFCPDCGSTVSWEIDRIPGFTAVAVGAFADPTFPAPKISIYEARRHPWAVMPRLEAEHID